MDRVERHDVINSIALAAVLLAMALGLVWGARALFSSAGNTIDAESSEDGGADGDGTADGETDGDADDQSTTTSADSTTTIPAVHLPSEVIVRVGNGARKSGIAGAGTELVQSAGYDTLEPDNAPSTETSVVYHVEGYEADAVQIARILNIAATAVQPMPEDPGIPPGDAHVVVILGADSTVL